MTKYSELSDSKLAFLLNQGDQRAYTEIYHRYYAALYIHVYNKLRLREVSRDIVHDLFSNLWDKRESQHINTSLSAYLYAAARYRVFDYIAHSKVEAGYFKSIQDFALQAESNTDHLLREKQLIALIEAEIAALPSKMREIFELSRKAHLTHQQIAEQLGLSEKTVKKQVNNSLKILRTKLGSALFTAFIL